MSNCQLCDRIVDERNAQEQMGYTICHSCDGLYSDEELEDKMQYKRWRNAHPLRMVDGRSLAEIWRKRLT